MVDAEALGSDPGRRILIRGGTVLTMDPSTPSLPRGDVLIEGELIAAVGPDLHEAVADGAAAVVDAQGMIVIPGLQDTHRHCWQGQLRRLLVDSDLATYAQVIHMLLGPLYTPDDVAVGCELSAWGALDAGITCVLDFMHNPRSHDHADAAVDAFSAAKLRTIVACAPPVGSAWDGEWTEIVTRLRAERLSASEGLVTLRAGLFGDHEILRRDMVASADKIRFARELGLEITIDAAFGEAADLQISELGRQGILGPDVTLIHCCGLGAAAWDAIASRAVRVSLCPTSDSQLGIADALPPIQETLDRDLAAGISVDVECSLSTDMFAQMQAVYTIQRMNAFRAANAGGPAPEPIATAEVLALATAGGARVNGLLETTGTLTSGKQADVVLIDGESVGTMPLSHPAGTVVLGAGVRDVSTVFVAGAPRKWRGELVGCDVGSLRRRVGESRDRLLRRASLELPQLEPALP